MHRSAAPFPEQDASLSFVFIIFWGMFHDTTGAPSFDLFGAFFPAWLLCGIAGIAGPVATRVAFVSSGVADGGSRAALLEKGRQSR
jgi:hypothetical protein